MYKAAGRAWDLFRHALKYRFGYSDYFIAFEISVRAKALHIHGIVRSKKLAAAIALQPGERPEFFQCLRTGKKKRRPTIGERAVWKNWMKPTAMKSGFGFKCELSAVNDHAAMSGYLVKASNISGELSQSNSKDQLPIDAPKGFRRIRASRRFLVPKIKNEEVTGKLIQRPVEYVESNNGDRMVYLAQLEASAPRVLLSYLARLEKLSPAVAGVEARIAFLEKHRGDVEVENNGGPEREGPGKDEALGAVVSSPAAAGNSVTSGLPTLGVGKSHREGKHTDRSFAPLLSRGFQVGSDLFAKEARNPDHCQLGF
jgi:hypothetical protein